MKRILTITLMLLLVAGLVYAGPTDQGSITLGGTISFQSYGGELYENSEGKGRTSFQFSPEFGYFLIDDLELGGTMVLSGWSFGDNSSSTAGVGLVGAFYLMGDAGQDAKGTMRPYVKGKILMLFNTSKYEVAVFGGNTTEVEDKESEVSLIGRLGIDFFLSNSVALDGGFDINLVSHDFDTEDDDLDAQAGAIVGLSLGISAFIF